MADTLNLAADVSQTPLWRQAAAGLREIYGKDARLESCLTDLMQRVNDARRARPQALIDQDLSRRDNPNWFLRPGRPAYCTYIDRYAGTLEGTRNRLDYLEALKVGLFHPLPLLKPRDGDSDGGFAVADYREVDPRLGTMSDLRILAEELRARDMSLVLDMVCNHTAKEHPWAQRMLAGDPGFADFYIVLNNRSEVDEWEAHLQDVFPDTAPGSFTYDARAGGYVWTTFYPFQWDLNYANPRVFVEMADCLFFLANAGVEGFRLDSTAYLWKRKGTISRNLPQTHLILQALRALLTLVAPSTFLLAEAIESQASVLPFFGTPEAQECDLAYNNGVMTALWGALADGRADILETTLSRAAGKPVHGHWLNYVRCHDDIIWLALSDTAEAERLQHWSKFYAGGNSFAKGEAFQAPDGFPASTCGMAASLCGGAGDPHMADRLRLLYGITYALEGIPLLYMGDEIALENFEAYREDSALREETRWLHRPVMDWEKADRRNLASSMECEMFDFHVGLGEHLRNLSFKPGQTVRTDSDGKVLIVERSLVNGLFVCVANLSGTPISHTTAGRLLVGSDASTLPAYGLRWEVHEDEN